MSYRRVFPLRPNRRLLPIFNENAMEMEAEFGNIWQYDEINDSDMDQLISDRLPVDINQFYSDRLPSDMDHLYSEMHIDQLFFDMEKLPPKILMEILSYLDEQQLVKLRLVSSQWNEICCLLLQEKTKNNPDSKLIVKIKKPRGDYFLECTTTITKSLDCFLKCFAPSTAEKLSGRHRPFPFSRFCISDLHEMENSQMTQFVSLFDHIKSLFLDIKSQDTRNVERFWRLLLTFATNIEHLGFSGSRWTQVELFGPYFNLIATPQNQEETFLNKLKVVEIKLENGNEHHEYAVLYAMYNLLEQTPNVQELICHQPTGPMDPPRVNAIANFDASERNRGPICGQFHLLQLWQQFNRSHLLKKLELNNTVINGSQRYDPPAVLMRNLQLENLTADCSMRSVQNEKATINNIYHAIKSSWNTLSNLDLYNVATESMKFCFHDISSLPNVRQLKIQVQVPMETGSILDRFSQLCPSITSLELDRLTGENLNVARILWTGFKGLKYLKVVVDLTKGSAYSLALDSTFSGYSVESIQRIQSKLKKEISMEEARAGEPQEASILDLKGLSRLELEFFMEKRSPALEYVKNRIQNSIFMKILPQHIREYPRSILFYYF